MIEPNESTNAIAARLAIFKATSDPNRLWLDVSRDRRIAAQRRILTVTKDVLNEKGSPARLGIEPLDGTRALSVGAHVLGVGPLLGYWCERGRLDADAEIQGLFATHLEHGRRRAQVMHQRAAEILDSCNRRGVLPIVLKGMHTSSSYFPERGTRPISDIDLLIEESALSRTREALAEHGLQEVELSHGQSTWLPCGEPLVVRSLDFEHEDNPWSVDLHTYIDRRYFWGLWSRFGHRPFRETREWRLDVHTARVFTQPLLAAYLAQHAVHDFRYIRLIRIVELILVLQRDIGKENFTWDKLASFLAHTKTSRFAFPALRLSAWLAPNVVDSDFLGELAASASPRLRRVINRWWEVGIGLDDAGSWDERLMWARTPFEHVRNVAHQITRRSLAELSPVRTQRLRWHLRQLIRPAKTRQ